MTASLDGPRRFVSTAGGPEQRGRQYGSQAADEIRRAIGAYATIVASRRGCSWATAVRWAGRYDECIGDLTPRCRAELVGVAAGAGVDYGDILALNCRSELLFVEPGVVSVDDPGLDDTPLPDGECSSFALSGAGGRRLAGQNWDWNPLLAESVVFWGAVPHDEDDEPTTFSVAEAGHLAKVGVNSAGVAVCTNTLVSTSDDGFLGLPYHVLLRELLRCRSVDQAVSLLDTFPRAMSANYLIADASGTARDVETAGGVGQGLAVLEPWAGVLCHTNHFLDGRLAPGDARAALNPHTRTRLDALQAGLGAARAAARPAPVFAALRDHVGYPNSVCSHPSETETLADQRATLASVVVDLVERVVWVADGPPCQHRFEAYRVLPTTVRREPALDEESVPTAIGGEEVIRV